MTKLSLNKAAKVAHKTKTTIKEDLDSGKLSGSKNARGHWEIEESELFRAYDLKTDDLVSNQSPKPHDITKKIIETSALETEVKMLREAMAWKDEILEEIRKERDDWKGQAKQLLIANQNTPETVPFKDTRSAWDRLLNRPIST